MRVSSTGALLCMRARYALLCLRARRGEDAPAFVAAHALLCVCTRACVRRAAGRRVRRMRSSIDGLAQTMRLNARW
jgi:hypothetical protein